jgi:N-methylhydantoinase B
MEGGLLDAIDLEIRWQRLISFLAEAALTVVKTSFSKIVSEGGDFGCLLYDRDGRMIAQDAGVSSKLAPSPRTVLAMIERYPLEKLRPGDVFITNDPWLCCGHLYDISVIKPLFHEGRVVGFGECFAHVPDVGGSLTNDSREVYEEGLCLPVVRLIAGGRDVDEIWDIIRSNVRVPDQLEGDIRAFIAALTLAGNRLEGFLQDYRLTDLQGLADQIIKRSEEAVRESIRKNVPAGVYRNRITLDGLESGSPLWIEVAITSDEDGSITVDYSGTDPQSSIGINCTEVYTHAWTLYSIRCIVAPSIPYNHGLFQPVRMVAPEGTFLNARHPAPVRMKSSTGNFIPFAIFGALATVVPERVIAESGIKCVIRCFAAAQDGRSVAETPHFMGGIGARYSKEGVSCMSFPAAGAETPVEMLENSLPITILYKRLIPDSGGPGRYRGGLGQEIGIRAESLGPVRLLVQNMKVHTPAIGYAGGKAGHQGCNRLNGQELPGKTTVSLNKGESIAIRLSGGGGMFDPFTRPVDAVISDVVAGLVTTAGALQDYGVVVSDSGELDEAATRRARDARAA